MVNRKFFFISTLFILAVGTGVGVFLARSFPGNSAPASPITSSSAPEAQASFSNAELINPTIISNLNKHFIINFRPLRESLVKIQAAYPRTTYIYFDYLNNASWVGLNEREMFTAASTIKVPLAMSVYKAVEEKKLRLDERYALAETDLDDKFGELYKVGAGAEFTVDELLKIMLEQSDNTAANALFHVLANIGVTDPLADAYVSMGWDVFSGFGDKPTYQKISLKTLSNMFLALYNAEYVNVEHSEAILSHLSHTPFNKTLPAGVPMSVVVSHKIGVSDGDKTFSDCGIIYAPNRHYLLCVGSSGNDEATAQKFMAEVSKTVYDYVIHN